MSDNKKKNTFDNVISTSIKPVAGFSVYQDLERNKESPAEKIYDKIETTHAQSIRNKQIQGLVKEDTGEGQGPSSRSPKRYLVDPSNGVISIDEEEGDLSYRDAVLTSASIIATLRAQSGDSSDGAVEIFKEAISAIKENRASTSQDTERKKEFYVDDVSGVIIQDPENGDLTLSEARAIAQSRKRVVPNEGITKEGLELLKRDMRDEVKQAIENTGKGNQEPAFTFDADGKPVLNPNSKGMSIVDVLAWQFITKSQNPQGNLYKTDEGNILSLDDALSLKRFDREEARLDKKADSLQGIIADARKQMPLIGEGIKEMLSQRTIARQQEANKEQEAASRREIIQESETEKTPGGETLENQSAEV